MKNNDAEALHKDTEKEILQAAEKEFLKKGFAGARTTSIAEAAGVNHAMLHYYFRTKRNLFERILAEKIELLKFALFSPIENPEINLQDVIRNVIERHLDFLAANPELPRFLLGEIYNQSEHTELFLSSIQKYAPTMVRVLQQKIDEAVSRGEVRHADAASIILDIASLNIFSFIAAPILNSALPQLSINSEEFIEKRKKENYDTIMAKLKP